MGSGKTLGEGDLWAEAWKQRQAGHKGQGRGAGAGEKASQGTAGGQRPARSEALSLLRLCELWLNR